MARETSRLTKPVRIVFVGASSLGLKVLTETLGVAGVQVVGVITGPNSFNISYSSDPVVNVLHLDYSEFCRESQLPLLVSSRGFSDLVQDEIFESWRPDVFLVAGWYHMVPKSWRRRAIFLGVHASLLPKYSGGAPLVWAKINGESESGVTIFRLEDGVDDGPILAQDSFPIEFEDDISDILKKAEQCATSLARSALGSLALGEPVFIHQLEEARTIYPQRGPNDGVIDPSIAATSLVSFIRAQTRPYPGAFFESERGRLKVWSARLCPDHCKWSGVRRFVHCGSRVCYVSTDRVSVELQDYDYMPRQEFSLEAFMSSYGCNEGSGGFNLVRDGKS